MSSRLAIPTTGAASVTLSFSAFTSAALRLNTAAGPTTQVKVPYAGTYSVNPDCTVEDIWVNQLNGRFNTHESILVDHGKELLILVTTAGAPPIVSGVGRKLFPASSDRD